MRSILRRILTPWRSASASSDRLRFLDEGFHGDRYLIRFIEVMAPRMRNFVETGCNVGSTLAHVLRSHPHLECFSCEPDAEAYRAAVTHVSAWKPWLQPMMSQEFLPALLAHKPRIVEQPTLFWLDAHGYGFDWPLVEELTLIIDRFRDFVVVVDDFRVPSRSDFGFDQYGAQECSHRWVRPRIGSRKANLYYPNYREHTSKHHPLRGWGVYSSTPLDLRELGVDWITPSPWAEEPQV